MKVLVTGGAGFIGSHVVETYLEAGHEVGVLDKKAEQDLPQALLGRVQYFSQDITKKGLEDVFQVFRPQVVNHHAALINVFDSLVNPVIYTKTNVYGTVRLLELCQAYGIKQFLFASSVAVYGNSTMFPITENQECRPESVYALDKYCGEKYIDLFKNNFCTTIFRYANVYGPRQNSSAEGGVVAIFASNLKQGKIATIFGDGNQTRDFIYVKDIAFANLLATEKQKGGLLNVSSSKEISVNELLKKIQFLSGKDVPLEYKPARKGDVLRSVLSNKFIKSTLKWEPQYSLESGLKQTLQYFNISV
ncbi:MAG: NAD-dependent epimerase/dehydratase family protein [Patescibacteria group bacterium]|jgi:UDP-glucose 4-epimerase